MPQNLPYRVVYLKNGLKFALWPNSSDTLIFICATVRAGRINDPSRLPGLAHVVEHAVYNGTKKFPTQLSLAQILESGGGKSNAHTHTYTTSYLIEILPENLENALLYLSEILFRPIFPESELEKTKRIVDLEFNEWDYFIGDEWSKTLFGQYSNSHATPYFGDVESIKFIETEDLKQFHKAFYYPSNVTISFVGNIEDGDSDQTIINFFEEILSPPQTENSISPPDFSKNEKIKSIERTTKKSYIVTGFTTYATYNSPDYLILRVIAELLGDGDTSILRQLLIFHFATAYQIRANVVDRFYTTLEILGEFHSEGLPTAVIEIVNSFKKILEGDISNSDFISAKNKDLLWIMNKLSSSKLIAEDISNELATTGKILLPSDEIQIVSSLTVEDLVRVAKKYFTNDHFYSLIVGSSSNLEQAKNIFLGTLF